MTPPPAATPRCARPLLLSRLLVLLVALVALASTGPAVAPAGAASLPGTRAASVALDPPSVTLVELETFGFEDGIRVRFGYSLGWGWKSGPDDQGDVEIVLAPSGVDDVLADPAPVGVAWRASRRLPDSTFESFDSVDVPLYRTEQGASYSLYVAQDAVEGLRPRRQSEMPLDIDWSVVDRDISIAVGPRVTVDYDAGWLFVDTPNAPRESTVSVTGLPGGPRAGRPGVRYFPLGGVLPGAYPLQIVLDTPDGVAGDGLTATTELVVVRGRTTLGTSFVRVPTPRYTGLFRVGIQAPYGALAPAGAKIAAKVYRGDALVWYSGVRDVVDGGLVFRLPALPRGSYRVVTGWAGTPLYRESSVTRTFAVR